MMHREKPKGEVAVIASTRKAGVRGLIGIAAFVGAWSLLAWSSIVSPLILPSPLRVLGSVTDIGWPLAIHIAATVLRIVIGFTLGSVAGLGLGILMQYNRTFYEVADGIVETFRPVPPVALVPFFILIFGFAETGKILITTLGTALIVTVTVLEAIARVQPGVIRWGLVCGLSHRQLFGYIILPAAWPEMRGGFRIALAGAITLVVVSEFMGATYGLGYLISVSKVTLTTSTIFLAVMLLGWIGWIMDRLLRMLFDSTSSWDPRIKEATR